MMQAKQKQDLIKEILDQPIVKEFKSFKGFTGDMPSTEITDYS